MDRQPRSPGALTSSSLERIVEVVTEQWPIAGDLPDVRQAGQISFQVTPLGGSNLGLTVLVHDHVGQTVSSTILIDTDAAGYGWFIDTTPDDNSEFVLTDNPGEFRAPEGSSAFGRIDLLTVIAHEWATLSG